MTAEELKAFENDIAAIYERGEIPYPIHLSGGNESQLIEIFKEIRECDAIFGSWRFHYHCLLKGVPPAELKSAIVAGHSIALKFTDRRIFSSAIVGGILPIAVGYALSIKRNGGSDKVWCFVGDMSSYTGIFHECLTYSKNFDLPIQFIIEDNGLSVKTPTLETWGGYPNIGDDQYEWPIRYYCYQPTWPHSGIGRRVDF